jgi:hypothetical protein
MSEQLPNQEEVDLGQLFKLIGQGISNFIKGVKNFFIGLLNLFIQIALFLKKNFVKIAIVTFLGFAFGLYKDYTNPTVFEATMQVRPNNNSTQQLYNEVEAINNAIKQKNSSVLKQLELNTNDFVYAEIMPLVSNKIQLDIFNDFIKTLDTTTIKDVDYNRFVKELANTDYPDHKIVLSTNNQLVFDKYQKLLFNNVSKNTLLQARQKVSLENLNYKEEKLKKSLRDIDSLRVIYNKVLLAEAKKVSSGTKIITAKQDGKSNVELELYAKKNIIINDLNNIAQQKANNHQLIQIGADFSSVGKAKKTLLDRQFIKFGVFAFLLSIVLILLFNFNSYLNKL